MGTDKILDFSISKSGSSIIATWKNSGKKHDAELLLFKCVDGASRVRESFPAHSCFRGKERLILEAGFAPAVEIDDQSL